MQLTEINNQLQEKFGNDCLAALEFFTPIIEVQFTAVIGKSRSMDIFEEHVLQLVNASGGSIGFDEAVQYLGCGDSSFLEDAVKTLSVSSALNEDYTLTLTKGDTFEKSIKQLSIDEADQKRVITVWCDVLGRKVLFRKPSFLKPCSFEDKIFGQIVANSGAFKEPVLEFRAQAIEQLLLELSPDLIREKIHDSLEACDPGERILSMNEFEVGESYCIPVVAMGLVDKDEGGWYIECYDLETEQMLPQFSHRSFLSFLGERMHELYEEQQQESDSNFLSPPLPIEFIDDDMIVAQDEADTEEPVSIDTGETTGLTSACLNIANTTIEVKDKDQALESELDGRSYVNETLGTLDAAKRLIEDINNAKHEIIINVPFLNVAGVGQVWVPFKQAVEQRECKVLVLWGISETYEEECSHGKYGNRGASAEKAERKLHEIIDSNGCNTPTVEWRPSDHSKWVMIDRMIYYHGGYNVLSYVHDPKREKSVRVERMERYQKAPLEKIAINLDFIPSSLKHPENVGHSSWKDWFKCWHPSLRLCCTPTVIDKLISNLPEHMHGPRELRVLIETLKGATMALVSQSCSPDELNDAIHRLTEQFAIDQNVNKAIKKRYNKALNDYKKVLGVYK